MVLEKGREDQLDRSCEKLSSVIYSQRGEECPKYRAFHNVLCDYIYNKKTKGPILMELFTATGKLKKFFLQLEMFDVCTSGEKTGPKPFNLQSLMGDHLVFVCTDTQFQ